MPLHALAYVAPARERGLKYQDLRADSQQHGRSREGAWIEISIFLLMLNGFFSRSREGAWIEISYRVE